MNRYLQLRFGAWLIVFAGLGMFSIACLGAEHPLYVSPTGDDRAAGTKQAPFQTLYRAQQAARSLAKDMRGDVVVNLAPGVYRLDRTLEFTEADSGRNGFRMIYRSASGPGKARLVGSVPLTGWQAHHNGIWKVDLPKETLFHTLYENGQRVLKARFPDYQHNAKMPTALGRYLVSAGGSPKQSDRGHARTKEPGWLVYRPEDAPPVTAVTKMRIHIFPGGKWDWVREIHPVNSIDPQKRRLTFKVAPFHGVGVGARFFLEDELGFLNVPGEFFLDQTVHTLYYIPLGKEHPDALGISCPVLSRMIQLQGKSREQCVEHLVLEGLALEETDNAPPMPLWAYSGRRDGALIWMSNTAHVEIRNCHLKNGGRSGIMMIGHNTENLVSGCRIEHMGLNGVSFCNRFLAPNGKDPTEDRCQNNRVHNTHISHVGELHTYAECVTVFNVSNNEVDHCKLDNSVRYAITLRGNTGPQYGPPVSTNHPPTKGNRFHHIRVERCGQDGGDMGALHAANLNNPGGGCVNTFEQVTVTDTRAIPSVKDTPPNGVFLDWPKMSMDQVFRNVQIMRSQGAPLRSHGPDNGASARTENVSWKPDFREDRMDYANIGLTADFPAEYRPRPACRKILFLGNSITRHGPAQAIGWSGNWGMAASAKEKDFVHVVVSSLAKATGTTPQVMIKNIATFERQYASYDVEGNLKDAFEFGADLVIVAIGENVPNLDSEEAKTRFAGSLRKLLGRLTADNRPAIVVRSCFWPNRAKDEILKQSCRAVGGIFVDISELSKDESNYARSERKFAHGGVAAHPGDKGMQAIADAILGAIKE